MKTKEFHNVPKHKKRDISSFHNVYQSNFTAQIAQTLEA